MNNILVTGCAGFIGSRVSELLLESGQRVFGVDNLNDDYDIALKQHRLQALIDQPGFSFELLDIEDGFKLNRFFQGHSFDGVIHLAARAGVRASLKRPSAYLKTNVMGCLNVLECMRDYRVPKLVLASSSTLYAGHRIPFSEAMTFRASWSNSPYAVSKFAAESAAASFHQMHGIDVSILRYFSVYGPAGRPDMIVYRLIDRMENDEPIEVFGDGSQARDFTYVDDIACGTLAALRPIGFEVINLGSGNPPVSLNELITMIEGLLSRRAKRCEKPAHPTDIHTTQADISTARQLLAWVPKVSLASGLQESVDWYRTHLLGSRQIRHG